VFLPPRGTPINRRYQVVLAFALVYVFWGSTYLGISVAVQRIPPILMAGLRFSIAGSAMLVFCRMRGRRTGLTFDQFWRLAVIGILLLAISNAVLAWAELHVPTGLAALIVSITPIWFLFIDHGLFGRLARRWTGHGAASRKRPVGRTALAGVGLGIVGMVILLWPRLRETHALGPWQLFAAVSLLGSSFSWAFGSVLAREWHVQVDTLVGAGWQMVLAGVVDVAVGLLLREHRVARWDPAGLGAVLYLVVFGSWVGYSAYVWLLRHVRTTKVATYAYVNPVVAVILGWLILGEPIDRFMLAGAAVIVPAVALVTTAEHDIEPAD
jgi:drug/metabolite transporter (DMT)-like permease